MVKLINCSGYAQTGCTAQVHVLSQYHSVEGVLKTKNEFGVLKIPNSFGAVILSDILGQALPTRDDIHLTLMGKLPDEGEHSWSYTEHVKGFAIIARQYGEPYAKCVEEAIELLPETFEGLPLLEKFEHVKQAFRHWADGIATHMPDSHFTDDLDKDIEPVLGLKNDPVGAHPLLTGLLPDDSISSAIIRDPRDTNVDFNRHYGIGHTEESTRAHCRIYNSQIGSALKQIKSYREHFDGKYFIIEFERLVTEENYRDRYVKKMVGDRPKVREAFFPEESAKNIAMYKNYDPALIEIVEEECFENYKDFLVTVKEEGLLME